MPVDAQLCALVPQWGWQPAGRGHSEPVSHTKDGGYAFDSQLI